jgi:hypothetical protein
VLVNALGDLSVLSSQVVEAHASLMYRFEVCELGKRRFFELNGVVKLSSMSTLAALFLETTFLRQQPLEQSAYRPHQQRQLAFIVRNDIIV